MEIQYQPYFPMAVVTNIFPFLWERLRKTSFRPSNRQTLRYIICSYSLVQERRTWSWGSAFCRVRLPWDEKGVGGFLTKLLKKRCYVCYPKVHTLLLQFSLTSWFCSIYVNKKFLYSNLVKNFLTHKEILVGFTNFPTLSQKGLKFITLLSRAIQSSWVETDFPNPADGWNFGEENVE